MKNENKLRPTLETWRYLRGEISVDMIISSLADKIGGYSISYSGNLLLDDLGFLTKSGNVNKKGKVFLAHELHERFHRKVPRWAVIITPEESKGNV